MWPLRPTTDACAGGSGGRLLAGHLRPATPVMRCSDLSLRGGKLNARFFRRLDSCFYANQRDESFRQIEPDVNHTPPHKHNVR
jgi:hypothetical protein